MNKAAYAFCLGAMANGVYSPYPIRLPWKPVSAFTVTASTMLAPRLFKEFEIETGKSTWLLGLAGITEGAIPMAIEDPLRVIGSFVLGSMVTGAIEVRSISLRHPVPAFSRSFYFMIMARAVLWRQLAGLVRHWWGLQSRFAILLIWRRHAVKHGNYLTDGVMP